MPEVISTSDYVEVSGGTEYIEVDGSDAVIEIVSVTSVDVVDVGTQGPTGPQGPAGPSGSIGTLDGLDDVTITSAGTNDALQFNGSGWVNSPITESDISDLGAYLPLDGTGTMTGDLNLGGQDVVSSATVGFDQSLTVTKSSNDGSIVLDNGSFGGVSFGSLLGNGFLFTFADASDVNATTAVGGGQILAGVGGASATDSRLYRSGVNEWSFEDGVNGNGDVVGVANLTASATVSAAELLLADGSAADPSLAYTSEPDTGFYRSTTDTLGFAAGGSSAATLSTSLLDVAGSLTVNGTLLTAPTGQWTTKPEPGIAFAGTSDTGLLQGTNLMHLVVNGDDTLPARFSMYSYGTYNQYLFTLTANDNITFTNTFNSRPSIRMDYGGNYIYFGTSINDNQTFRLRNDSSNHAGLEIGSLEVRNAVDSVVASITDAGVIDGTSVTVSGTSVSLVGHTHTYVDESGDTMTGQLLIDLGSDTEGLVIQGDASQSDDLLALRDSGNTDVVTVSAGGDVEVHDSSNGIILQSPDATRWRVTIDNTGALTSTAL